MAGAESRPVYHGSPSGARDGLVLIPQADDVPGDTPLATLAIALKDINLGPDRSLDLTALPEAEAIALIKKPYGFLSTSIEVTIQQGIALPCEFMGISSHYEPDFLVRLVNDITLILEIKGLEDDHDRAKHEAAKRWVKAVNNWGQLGQWAFHVCRDPAIVARELAFLSAQESGGA